MPRFRGVSHSKLKLMSALSLHYFLASFLPVLYSTAILKTSASGLDKVIRRYRKPSRHDASSSRRPDLAHNIQVKWSRSVSDAVKSADPVVDFPEAGDIARSRDHRDIDTILRP